MYFGLEIWSKALCQTVLFFNSLVQQTFTEQLLHSHEGDDSDGKTARDGNPSCFQRLLTVTYRFEPCSHN